MLKALPWLLLAVGVSVISTGAAATTETVVNLNVKHSTDGKDKFDRKNHIILHSTLTDNDWVGEEDKLKYMMEDLDVYFGRDNGSTVWNFNQADQDASRSGYADPGHIATRGEYSREVEWAVNKQFVHKYDGRGDIMVGGQPYPHWFGVTNPFDGGPKWQANADGVGDFLGQYLNEFYRSEGQAIAEGHLRPTHFEVLNEPLYQLTDAPEDGNAPVPPLAIFQYHNQVADAVRRHNTEIKIGGYVAAFPVFEERDFSRWNERMKLFIDTSGQKMDYYSTHFYDLEDTNRYKGSRIEATLDMIDHYSLISLGEVKPHIISEYGGRDRPSEKQPWSALRDWAFLKAASPMLLQFLDRPDTIEKTIPFVPVKALWGTQGDIPYPWRLLRQAKEAAGEEGDDWVFTEMVKFYELWSDVNGTRVDTFSTNPDILVDSYVDGNKAYVIVSNLTDAMEKLILHKFGAEDNQLDSLKIKHLYLDRTAPVLDVEMSLDDIGSIDIAPEATLIIEYTFASDVIIDSSSEEHKYYAQEFFQEIEKDVVNQFNINGIAATEFGEAYLRIVLGRQHGALLSPKVKINDVELGDPLEIAGDLQAQRAQFFGLLEISVPLDVLNANNKVEITFADNGGHVTSVNLKLTKFDQDIRPASGPVGGIVISPETGVLAVGETLTVQATVTPFFATNQVFTLESSQPEVATVSPQGLVTGLTAGTTIITATTDEGQFVAQAIITVEEPVQASLTFDDRSKYVNTVYQSGGVMDVTVNFDAGTGEKISADFGGIDFFFRHLESNYSPIRDIKANDSSAVGQRKGTSSVSIPLDDLTASDDLQNGEFYFLFVRFKTTSGDVKTLALAGIKVEESVVSIDPSLTLDDPEKYRNTLYTTNDSLDIKASFEAGLGNTVSADLNGVKFFLRELTSSFGVVNDYTVSDASAIGEQSGIASASISLTNLTPSTELPEGNFYFLFALFKSSDGSTQNIDGVFPITIEQGVVEPSFGFEDSSSFTTTEYFVGGELNVSVNFEMGSGNSVGNAVGGIRYFLRELTAGFQVVKDVVVEDASVIGQQSGTSNAVIPLDGLTPTSDLADGNFYFLFALTSSDDGTQQNVAAFPISIEKLTGDFDVDGDVDFADIVALTRAIRAGQVIAAEFDLNNDGTITSLDTRVMRSLCTRARCSSRT